MALPAVQEQKMKAEVFDALHRIEGHTECLIESAKEKALYAGEKSLTEWPMKHLLLLKSQ